MHTTMFLMNENRKLVLRYFSESRDIAKFQLRIRNDELTFSAQSVMQQPYAATLAFACVRLREIAFPCCACVCLCVQDYRCLYSVFPMRTHALTYACTHGTHTHSTEMQFHANAHTQMRCGVAAYGCCITDCAENVNSSFLIRSEILRYLAIPRNIAKPASDFHSYLRENLVQYSRKGHQI